ncbi:energy transducer TonB, partial [Salmonella enterica]|nr:energy transducer TonB [Salmonella enterica]
MEVLLVAQLNALGHVSNVMVVRSSGLRQIDRAAFTAVDQWRFEPVVVEGAAVPARVRVRVSFAATAEAPPGSSAAPICRNWSY